MLIPGMPKSLSTQTGGVSQAWPWSAGIAHLPGKRPDSGAGQASSNETIGCLKATSNSRRRSGVR